MTGSVVNEVMGHAAPPAPAEGMGATKLMRSDRRAFTVVKVVSPRKVVVRRDTAKLVSGSSCSESQEYTFLPDPNGAEYTVTLRKNGAWVVEGEDMKGGTRFALGVRDEYSDPSF